MAVPQSPGRYKVPHRGYQRQKDLALGINGLPTQGFVVLIIIGLAVVAFTSVLTASSSPQLPSFSPP